MQIGTVAIPLIGTADVWLDAPVLALLRTGSLPEGLGPREVDRVTHRASRYTWHEGFLFHQAKDMVSRVVPEPSKRDDLIIRAHEDLGHFGERRVHFMLRAQHWWFGMRKHIREVLARCSICDRVRSSFTAPSPSLQSLPIMGLGYRWGVDYAGPLPMTKRKNRYVFVMIEHFSKWVEIVPVPDKSSEISAAVFLDRVLAHFGAPAEVVSDQGKEFLGEFDALCERSLIDHRQTSRNHPEANGLAERMVQTTKRALKKYGLEHGHHHDWDLQLPWLAMGYRFSRQESLAAYSPYQLLFGTAPRLPSSIPPKLSAVVDLDSPAVWASTLSERAEFFKRAMPEALGNLQVAQHRDGLRYARIRSGGYRPKVRRFEVGDFVYLQREAPTSIDVKAGRTVLQVKEILPSGQLLLHGQDAQEWREFPRNCAPCHLPMNSTVDPELAKISASLKCFTCGEGKAAKYMLLCDGCQRGWHTYCLRPPLEEVPQGSWKCPRCLQPRPRHGLPW